MDAVERGAPIVVIVRIHGIPKTSLADHVNGKNSRKKKATSSSSKPRRRIGIRNLHDADG